MNISNLEQYVESRNAWAKIFGNKQLSLLNKADRQKIADALDADLSPENLTCDGEVRGQALQNKFNFLSRCAAELQSIDPSVTFYDYS
jgi:hypothetical protein